MQLLCACVCVCVGVHGGRGNELLATWFLLCTARCLATMILQFLANANNVRDSQRGCHEEGKEGEEGLEGVKKMQTRLAGNEPHRPTKIMWL